MGLCLGIFGAAAAQDKPAEGEKPAAKPAQKLTVSSVVNVLGAVGIPRNAKCTLAVEGGNLRLESQKGNSEVPVASIDDVFTGEDSQRLIGGTVGTLSTFAPYGSGRFLSLFRKTVDSLTIEYHDANGGLHGVILRMLQGASTTVKRQLVASGAHASIPVEEEIQTRQAKKSKKPAKQEKP